MKFLTTGISVLICFCLTFLMVAPGCKRKEQTPGTEQASGGSEVVAVTTLLATIAENEMPHTSAAGHAGSSTDQKQPEVFHIEMNPHGRGAAYIARVGAQARVVLNGKPGNFYKDIDPYTLALSPDGQRIAYGAQRNEKNWFMVIDGREEGPFNEIGPPVFSPDSRHVAFEGKTGETWRIYLDRKRSAAAASYFEKPAFSADSKYVLYGENATDTQKQRIAISDLEFRKTIYKESYGETLFNGDKSRVALVNEVGEKKKMLTFSFDRPDAVTEGPLYDVISLRAFSKDGSAVAYLAKKGQDTYLVLNEKEERLPDGEYRAVPVVHTDNKGADMVIFGNDGAYLHQAFTRDSTPKKKYKEAGEIVYNGDGTKYAYLAIKNERFLIVVNGKEGPFFDRVISPKFSPDGNFLVYRARQDGKRFVVVADAKGAVIRRHRAYEMVFEQVFTADGKSVAYGVKDGNKLVWIVEKL